MSRSTVEAFDKAQRIDFDDVKPHQKVLFRVAYTGQDEPTIYMGTLTGATARVQNRLYVRMLDEDEIVSIHIDEIRTIESFGEPRTKAEGEVHEGRGPDEPEKIDPHDPEYRQKAILFNDVSRAPVLAHILLSDRERIAAYLYEQGWRREERPDDINSGAKA